MIHRNSNQGEDRQPPKITDHKMLSVIGRGSFGEVWLARSLTGSMRAIKVIRREDFTHGGSYEREFEGILNYEPISRQHPGLVDILQVGRNDAERYYYYVMELADHAPPPPEEDKSDEESAAQEEAKATNPDNEADGEWGDQGVPAANPHEIDPEVYRPDTLSQRIRERRSAPNAAVVLHGAALARGVAFLHSHGLVHRDIKPGNVVFIDGKAKLADVGLVTTAGDGTFVGTEGYVAPEGPGTHAGDIFSLGMVLYEMSTGKDRLDFPDLPDVLPEGEERIIWRRVNRAICRASARRPEARYQSGERLALALEGQVTEPTGGLRNKVIFATMMTVLLAGATTIFLQKTDKEVTREEEPSNALIKPSTSLLPMLTEAADELPTLPEQTPEKPPKDIFPTLEIRTLPPGADVYHGEQWLGTSPVFIDPAPSNAVSYNIRLEGHRIEQIDYLGASDDRSTINLKLTTWNFPQEGMRWKNSLGMDFFPSGERHLSQLPIAAQAAVTFARQTGHPFSGQAITLTTHNKAPLYLAAMTATTAKTFCRWLTDYEQEEGTLLPEQFYRPTIANFKSLQINEEDLFITSPRELLDIYQIEIDKIRYGSVTFSSEPAGAKVFRNGNLVGVTPFELPRVRAGKVEFEIQKEGHKTSFYSLEITDEKLSSLDVTLEKGQGVDLKSPWRNSIGMLFLPSANGILVSAFETRRREFARFVAKDKKMRKSPASNGLTTSPLHPATMVTRAEAEAFCHWLTSLERRRGIISQRHLYRLPTDAEWSSFAGLPPEKGRDPASRSDMLLGFFTWGFEWPPPLGSGNFAGTESIGILGIDSASTIPKFRDGFAGVAPVSSATAETGGLYQIGGNVAEWVSDRYGGTEPALADQGVIRGGTWRSWSRQDLNASHRRPTPDTTRSDAIGFRIILSLSD